MVLGKFSMLLKKVCAAFVWSVNVVSLLKGSVVFGHLVFLKVWDALRRMWNWFQSSAKESTLFGYSATKLQNQANDSSQERTHRS